MSAVSSDDAPDTAAAPPRPAGMTGGFAFAFQKSDHMSFNENFSEKYSLDKPFDEAFAKNPEQKLDVAVPQFLKYTWVLFLLVGRLGFVFFWSFRS